MSLEVKTKSEPEVSCASCEACCCRLEVMLINDTGVPERFIEADQWGGRNMARLDDGWCSALDRNTMLCTMYDVRCTMYDVRCTMYDVRCTMYDVRETSIDLPGV